MRIATWNVNGLRARLEFVLHWLKARQPDVVGMQETKASDDDFPHEELGALGYKVVNHGQKGWNGVAIVSRQEAEVQTLGLPGREEDGGGCCGRGWAASTSRRCIARTARTWAMRIIR